MSRRPWHPVSTAPYDQVVEVRVEGGKKFSATLRPDISIDEHGNSCDQWLATTDRYPRCWSEGACWESNADEWPSQQPIARDFPEGDVLADRFQSRSNIEGGER